MPDSLDPTRPEKVQFRVDLPPRLKLAVDIAAEHGNKTRRKVVEELIEEVLIPDLKDAGQWPRKKEN